MPGVVDVASSENGAYVAVLLETSTGYAIYSKASAAKNWTVDYPDIASASVIAISDKGKMFVGGGTNGILYSGSNPIPKNVGYGEKIVMAGFSEGQTEHLFVIANIGSISKIYKDTNTFAELYRTTDTTFTGMAVFGDWVVAGAKDGRSYLFGIGSSTPIIKNTGFNGNVYPAFYKLSTSTVVLAAVCPDSNVISATYFDTGNPSAAATTTLIQLDKYRVSETNEVINYNYDDIFCVNGVWFLPYKEKYGTTSPIGGVLRLNCNVNSSSAGTSITIEKAVAINAFMDRSIDRTRMRLEKIAPTMNGTYAIYTDFSSDSGVGTPKIYFFSDALEIPVIFGVTNGSITSEKQPIHETVLNGHVIAGATEYQVQLSPVEDFSAPTNVYSESDDVILPDLNAETIYYCRIRVSAPLCTDWSTSVYAVSPNPQTAPIHDFRTPVILLTKPVATYPRTGEANISTSPTLTWTTSEGANTYIVSYSTEYGFPSSKTINRTVKTNSVTITGLELNHTYYWKIVASRQEKDCDPVSSDVFSFTTYAKEPTTTVPPDGPVTTVTTATSTIVPPGPTTNPPIISTTTEVETVTIYVPVTRESTVTEIVTSTITRTKTYTTTEVSNGLFDFENRTWWIVTVIIAGLVIGVLLVILIVKK